MTVALSCSSKFVGYQSIINADRDGDFAGVYREIARITGPCELVELGSGSFQLNSALMPTIIWGCTPPYQISLMSAGILESGNAVLWRIILTQVHGRNL